MTLFVLAGDFEDAEELAPAARQKEKRKVLHSSETTGEIDQMTLFVLAGGFEVAEELAPAARQKEKRKVLHSSVDESASS